MNRHAPVSFALSFLLVLVFAVVLYRPDTEPTPRLSTTPESLASKVRKDRPEMEQASSLAPSHAFPTIPTFHSHPPLKQRLAGEPPAKIARPSAHDRVRGALVPTTLDEPTPPASPSRTPDRTETPASHEPRSAFTDVNEGESLVDIARRVYGSSQALERLRTANRDLLGEGQAVLSRGMVLRTP